MIRNPSRQDAATTADDSTDDPAEDRVTTTIASDPADPAGRAENGAARLHATGHEQSASPGNDIWWSLSSSGNNGR